MLQKICWIYKFFLIANKNDSNNVVFADYHEKLSATAKFFRLWSKNYRSQQSFFG